MQTAFDTAERRFGKRRPGSASVLRAQSSPPAEAASESATDDQVFPPAPQGPTETYAEAAGPSHGSDSQNAAASSSATAAPGRGGEQSRQCVTPFQDHSYCKVVSIYRPSHYRLVPSTDCICTPSVSMYMSGRLTHSFALTVQIKPLVLLMVLLLHQRAAAARQQRAPALQLGAPQGLHSRAGLGSSTRLWVRHKPESFGTYPAFPSQGRSCLGIVLSQLGTYSNCCSCPSLHGSLEVAQCKSTELCVQGMIWWVA